MSQSMTEMAFEGEIAKLLRMPRAELVERWVVLYHTPPPKGLGQRLLAQAIGYEMQAKRYGGLKPTVGRRLRKLGDAPTNHEQGQGGSPSSVQPGTRLVREWNGQTHMVEVVDKGFIWKGQRHRSLSAIARAITGARWSGPRFFGVTS
jgi:hypothetical protein